MIKPCELDSDRGRDLWDTITAAAAGDIPTLQRLLERDPNLSQTEYWYTQPSRSRDGLRRLRDRRMTVFQGHQVATQWSFHDNLQYSSR